MPAVKYPRTWHFPWSPGLSRDDRVQHDLSAFHGREVVVTEKMDGENTTMYRDRLHARSLDYKPHPSRAWVMRLHAQIRHDIPEGWRISGENVYATHSIHYEHLQSFFYVFSIWNDNNECLSWDDTVEWCEMLGLAHVRVLWRGIYDEERIQGLKLSGPDPVEGYVCRLADSFPFAAFQQSVVKYVRQGHVQTDEHWMSRAVVPNRLGGAGLGGLFGRR